MSIFGSIMDKIFHAAAPAVETAMQNVTQSAPAGGATPTAAPDSPATPTAPTGTSSSPVDVGAVLTQMASQKGGGGNWSTSRVDLLKLLDLDSSLNARKELAGELNVHVGADGTSEENIALHKAVMQKLAENGGKVPDSMKA